MSVTLQIRGGTYSEHTTFSGEERELTVNTTDWTLVVHDGMGNQYPVTGARGVQGIQGFQGNQGIQGIPGLSVFNIVIYLRSSGTPATPSGGSYNFGTFTLVPPINGWIDNIPVGSDPLYVSTALASIDGTSGTDSTLTWTSPVILAQDGAPGANTAGSAYDIWLAAGNTGGVTAFLDSLTGNTGATGGTGDSAYQVWLDDGNTGTISDYLNVLTGTDGTDGSDGTDGVSVFSPIIYLRASSTPSTPSGGSYNFGTLTLTAPSGGWAENVPTGTDPLFISNTTASSTSVGGTDSTLTWSSPSLLVQNGANATSGGDSAYDLWIAAGNVGTLDDFIETFGGIPGDSAYALWLEDGNTGDESAFFDAIAGADGLSITTVNLYRRSIASLTSNDKPSGNGSYNFATKTLTYDNSGNWFTYMPLPMLGVGEDLYISESTAFVVGTTGTDSVLSWSNPILQSKAGGEGPPGAGQYSKVITGTGWSNSLAVQAITDTNASRTAPVLGDIVTLLNTNNISNPNYTGWASEARHWAGSALGWQVHESFIDGNLIVQGSISGDKLVANSITADKLRAGDTSIANGEIFSLGQGAEIAGYQGVIAADTTGSASGKFAGLFASKDSNAIGVGTMEGNGIVVVGGSPDDQFRKWRMQTNICHASGQEVSNEGVAFFTDGYGLTSVHWGEASLYGTGAATQATLATDSYAAVLYGGVAPFTGCHDALLLKTTDIVPGDIVIDSIVINKRDVSDTITQVVPSLRKNQKGSVGIYAKKINGHIPVSLSKFNEGQDINGNHISIEDKFKDLLKDNDIIAINSVGEGQLNVCGEGGSLEIGDLITTSSIPGKGMKQDDDIIRSYTVAKVRENVTFRNSKDVKLVACIYLCG